MVKPTPTDKMVDDKMKDTKFKFWELLDEPEYEKISSIEIVSKESMQDRGLTVYDTLVKINGEHVEFLQRCDIHLWIGEPGVLIKLTFGVPTVEHGALKGYETYEHQIEGKRISKLTFKIGHGGKTCYICGGLL